GGVPPHGQGPRLRPRFGRDARVRRGVGAAGGRRVRSSGAALARFRPIRATQSPTPTLPHKGVGPPQILAPLGNTCTLYVSIMPVITPRLPRGMGRHRSDAAPRGRGGSMVAEKATHDINLHNVNLFLHDEFHEAFRVLRQEAPVHWNPGSARANGFWSLAKYEDILTISRLPEQFISSKGIAGSGEREPDEEDVARAASRQRGEGGSSIITMDPPRHVKMRRLVNKGFTPRAVNAMEPKIREMTRAILDEVGDRQSGDFVLEVSSRLPLAVICGLMGLPRESWDLMFDLTNAALGAGDPEYQQAQTGSSGHTNIAKE